MIRGRSLALFALLGILIGVVWIPRQLVDEALWSVIEGRLARRGVALQCEDPRLRWVGFSTGPCVLRTQVVGADLQGLEISVSGIFRPKLSVRTGVFGESCEIESDFDRLTIQSCGAQLAQIPQLAGLGFTAGQISVSGVLALRNKLAPESNGRNIPTRLAFSLRDVAHPSATTSRLGFGPDARTLFIPAFDSGSADGTITIQGNQKGVEISRLSSSLVRASEARFTENLTNSRSVLNGSARFTLEPDGQRRYGPFVEAIALSTVASGFGVLSSGARAPLPGSQALPLIAGASSADGLASRPSGAVPVPAFSPNTGTHISSAHSNREPAAPPAILKHPPEYTLLLSGSISKPSFRVLKTTDTR